MRGIIATVVLALVALTAAGAGEDAAGKELARLQGTWQVEQFTWRGKAVHAEQRPAVTFTFKGDLLIRSDRPDDPAKVKLDPSKKPAAIDFHAEGEVSRGIFKFEGEALWLCFEDTAKAPRPTEFVSRAKSQTVMMVLKRERNEGTKKQLPPDVAAPERRCHAEKTVSICPLAGSTK